jgi:hypothetical protein
VVNDTETAVPDLHKCQAVENLQTRVGAAAFGMFLELPHLFRVRSYGAGRAPRPSG